MCSTGGGINQQEFLLFLRHQLNDTSAKLRSLTEFSIVSLQSEPSLLKYIPPRHGDLTLSIADGYKAKETYRVISDSDRACIEHLATQSGDVINMTSFGIQTYRVRYHEAMELVDSMMKESNNKTYILSKVLPQMSSSADARKIVNKVLKNNKVEIARLKREIGALLRPLLGNPDGYYLLDLSHSFDRMCVDRLIELSSSKAHERSTRRNKLGHGHLGDCSQRGNWSCFRNEWFNGKAVEVNTSFLSPMPRAGKLEFDFVSERRCGVDDFVLSDVRVASTLVSLYLLRADERGAALRRLETMKRLSDATLNGDAKTVYERPSAMAREVGMFMEEFYANLHCRAEQLEKIKLTEAVKTHLSIDTRLAQLGTRLGREVIITRKNAHKFLHYQSLETIVDVNEAHRNKLLHMSRSAFNRSPSMVAGGGGGVAGVGSSSSGKVDSESSLLRARRGRGSISGPPSGVGEGIRWPTMNEVRHIEEEAHAKEVVGVEEVALDPALFQEEEEEEREKELERQLTTSGSSVDESKKELETSIHSSELRKPMDEWTLRIVLSQHLPQCPRRQDGGGAGGGLRALLLHVSPSRADARSLPESRNDSELGVLRHLSRGAHCDALRMYCGSAQLRSSHTHVDHFRSCVRSVQARVAPYIQPHEAAGGL